VPFSTGTKPDTVTFWWMRSLSCSDPTMNRRCVLVPVDSFESSVKKSDAGSTSANAGMPTRSPGRRKTPTVFQFSESAPVGAR
jgi:hypothetical protein